LRDSVTMPSTHLSTLIAGAMIAGTFLPLLMLAQQPVRPRLLGISQIVVRAHDLKESRLFYGDLLGFQEAFTIRKDRTAVMGGGLPPDQITSVFFKVNNRQYVVVMPEASPEESRFVRYAIETDDAEAMRLYLKSLGYSVPAKTERTPTGDLAFQTADPDGNAIQIMQYTPESLSVRSVGKYLSDDRLSRRIIHAGFSISKPESATFYTKAFATREFWRSDPTMSPLGAPRAVTRTSSDPVLAGTSNMKMPEGDDYIEWSVSRTRPEGAANNAGGTQRRSSGHIALETPADMAATLAAVEARPAFKFYKQTHEAHIGVNHKWQGNYFDPDGTRTEFMEHDTADGLPSPISHAPYFR
jgi:catechol 2,3-dioxygenase-like lactoylglutathione lyase family enzyme